MAFPKRDTGRVVVDGQTYLWHRDRDWYEAMHITVRHAPSARGQLLWLDFSANHFDFGPGSVCDAIEFARANGWTPTTKGPTLYIAFDETQFYFLPPGERHPAASIGTMRILPFIPSEDVTA